MNESFIQSAMSSSFLIGLHKSVLDADLSSDRACHLNRHGHGLSRYLEKSSVHPRQAIEFSIAETQIIADLHVDLAVAFMPEALRTKIPNCSYAQLAAAKGKRGRITR